MNKFVKLEEVNNSINIMETPLGKDALDHKRYPEVDRNALKEHWGALCLMSQGYKCVGNAKPKG